MVVTKPKCCLLKTQLKYLHFLYIPCYLLTIKSLLVVNDKCRYGLLQELVIFIFSFLDRLFFTFISFIYLSPHSVSYSLLLGFISCVHIVAKSAYSLRHVRPSVRLSICYNLPILPLDGFLSNLILGTFVKICRGYPNVFTIGQGNGHFS